MSHGYLSLKWRLAVMLLKLPIFSWAVQHRYSPGHRVSHRCMGCVSHSLFSRAPSSQKALRGWKRCSVPGENFEESFATSELKIASHWDRPGTSPIEFLTERVLHANTKFFLFFVCFYFLNFLLSGQGLATFPPCLKWFDNTKLILDELIVF